MSRSTRCVFARELAYPGDVGRTIVVAFVACARVAFAQPAGDAGDAAALFEAGRELLVANHPAEACQKFEAALAHDAGAIGPLMNLGLCNEQLDKLATAKRWFGRAKQRATELGLASTVAAADAKLGALVPHVPALVIAFAPSRPHGAVIAVDGAAIEGLRVEVDAGHHVIEIGGLAEPLRREVDARDGEVAPITIALASDAAMTISETSHRNAYIAGGIGAALLAGTLAVGLVGRHEYLDATTSDQQHDWKSIVRYGGSSAFVAGLAALGVGVWLYVSAPARTIVVPTVDEHGAGAQLTVQF